ncbi:MAG: hypothetical protein ACYTG6_10230, partial [Planctomycetota bacterium]
ELTEDGYYDAFTNLLKIYLAREQWQDAYDLAADCAESLKDDQGRPHGTGQAHARGVMSQLEDEGKVEVD